MRDIKTLIDKASKVCGSDAALAERMAIHVQVVSMLRHGRPMSPETAAELAHIAGLCPKQAAIDAMLTKAVGTRKDRILNLIFGERDEPAVSAAESAPSTYKTVYRVKQLPYSIGSLGVKQSCF